MESTLVNDKNDNNPENESRTLLAQQLVRRAYGIEPIHKLGIGYESVIITDGERVFKVFDRRLIDYQTHFKYLLPQLKGAQFMISTADVKHDIIEGTSIMIYPFMESEPYLGGREDEVIGFLLECAQRGIVQRDVKHNNFRVFSNGLKLVDIGWDIVPFDHLNFLFMVQRAYLMTRYKGAQSDFRSFVGRALKEWDMPELDGFNAFFNRVHLDMMKQGKQQVFIVPTRASWIQNTIKKFLESHADANTEVVIEGPSKDSIKGIVEQFAPCFCGEKKPDVGIYVDFRVPQEIERIGEGIDEFLIKNNRLNWVYLLIQNPFFSSKNEDFTSIYSRLRRYGYLLKEFYGSPHRPHGENEFRSDQLLIFAQKYEPEGNDVSLLIKTCFQDGLVIERLVRHLVRQLEYPDGFLEKVVVVDPKEGDFLRQFGEPTRKETIETLEQLCQQGIIDRFIISPDDPETCRAINHRWFGQDTPNTHSVRNIPVTPQIFGFEEVRAKYILQMDSDPIIIRRDLTHSYLGDMKKELRDNENVLSVGFNIAQAQNQPFSRYSSPGDGQFVPEVRICLIDRDRLLSGRPYPNSLIDGRLALTWYRSIEVAQKERHLVSLRGGNPQTFYIHPQNDRKRDTTTWFTILDRAEAGFVPDVQFGKVDLQGDYLDWSGPKRSEQFVFIISGRNIPYGRFLRCWQSVTNQSRDDWGAVIIDDASENRLYDFIRFQIREYEHRVTYINNPVRRGILPNIYDAIHNFCNNPQSIILILDMDDQLLSNDTLAYLSKIYDGGSDLTVGTPLKVGKGILPFIPDFVNPRNDRLGDVWMHLRTFRKYLFDYIDDRDMRKDGTWIDKFTEATYMVPMTEMATSPKHVRWPVYLWEPGHVRDLEHYHTNREIIQWIRGLSMYKVKINKDKIYRVVPPRNLLMVRRDANTVLMIRHGRKLSVRHDGYYFADLSEEGRKEARLFGTQLPFKVNLFLTSNVNRTYQTAACIKEGNQSNAEMIRVGDLGGIKINDHAKWDRLKEERGWLQSIYAWMKGEVSEDILLPFPMVIENLLSSMRQYIQPEQDKNIVIVTHDHVIFYLAIVFFGENPLKIGYLSGISFPFPEFLSLINKHGEGRLIT